MIKLNLGCGRARIDGYVNVDVANLPEVDVVHDLDVGPWPIETASAERIDAKDVFEHVANPIVFMTEAHRVLEPGGVLHIRTPHYRSRDAFTDPTHRRFPTEHTFDYWIRGTVLYDLHNAAYGGVAFEKGPRGIYLDRAGSLDVTLYKLVDD